MSPDVHRDDLHRLRHRDDREAGLPGDPVGRAVPGAGLVGADRRVGHQVHGGVDDPARVAVEDDRAVHLGQLAQPGGRERDVELEAAGRDRADRLVRAEHDQGAGTAAEDPLQPVSQRLPGAMLASVARKRWFSSARSVGATCLPEVLVAGRDRLMWRQSRPTGVTRLHGAGPAPVVPRPAQSEA